MHDPKGNAFCEQYMSASGWCDAAHKEGTDCTMCTTVNPKAYYLDAECKPKLVTNADEDDIKDFLSMMEPANTKRNR